MKWLEPLDFSSSDNRFVPHPNDGIDNGNFGASNFSATSNIGITNSIAGNMGAGVPGVATGAGNARGLPHFTLERMST